MAYIVHGNGIVWDKVNDRPLAKFAGGLFVTESESVAERLKENGYAVDFPDKPKRRKKAGG